MGCNTHHESAILLDIHLPCHDKVNMLITYLAKTSFWSPGERQRIAAAPEHCRLDSTHVLSTREVIKEGILTQSPGAERISCRSCATSKVLVRGKILASCSAQAAHSLGKQDLSSLVQVAPLKRHAERYPCDHVSVMSQTHRCGPSLFAWRSYARIRSTTRYLTGASRLSASPASRARLLCSCHCVFPASPPSLCDPGSLALDPCILSDITVVLCERSNTSLVTSDITRLSCLRITMHVQVVVARKHTVDDVGIH